MVPTSDEGVRWHTRAGRVTAGRMSAWVRDLTPGCCALVMATGIVAAGLRLEGWRTVGNALFAFAVCAFVALVVATVWRLLRYRSRMVADELNPSRSFGFFTVAAGANVVADQWATINRRDVALVFLAVGAVLWLVLGYVLPLALIAGHGSRPALAGADGTWFLWVVATQSVVVAVTALPGRGPAWSAPVAVAGWSVGVVLYLAIAGLVLGRLFVYPVRVGQLSPSYWVFMGATAISALAGAQVLRLAHVPLATAVGPIVAGLSVVLLAFGTWAVPALIVQSVRWEEARPPLLYAPDMWSIVFPVGMYGVAAHALGAALGVSWLSGLGLAVVWAGALLWALVFCSMVGTSGVALVHAVRRG
ncbi:MAG TPA: tellurite resistance/C4-dicarboxylate transporter family protein [Pseudonocardiaceae bacterium]|nr:tellurite resistance/C4-dicarboxylate transporter family protein [Pseudonocardiaceae bacterium]